MIDRISFKNYKIFKEKQTIELKPITILIGKNNSGKSAVIKLPTLINGAFKSTTSDILNITNQEVELGAELRDLVYGKAIRAIEFELENTKLNKKLSVNTYISGDNNKQTSIIESWKLDSLMEIHEKEGKYVNNLEQEIKCSFNGFNILGNFDNEILNSKDSFMFESDFIGPIRTFPKRDLRLNPSIKNNQIGIDGENAYNILISDAITTDKKVINSVAEWYKNNFEGWGLKINQDKSPVFQVEIYRDDLTQNIKDAGIGMSQVLPIVTRAFTKCDEETLIMIEEPETHLHPAAHGNLAQLFVESLEDANKYYLVETHSLNFILRLRRLVAEKKVKKDNIRIYYVDFLEDKNYSVIKEIVLDDLGGVEFWPDKIFNETLEETVAIRTAQLNDDLEDENRN